MKKKEFILYGLDNYKDIINKITLDLHELDNCIDYFDIRLMLTEALTNAFKHGNNNNKDKPIFLRYFYDNSEIVFEIEDSGEGFINVTIPDEILYENILNNQGRGLYLIKCIADEIELKSNRLIIKKHLTKKITCTIG